MTSTASNDTRASNAQIDIQDKCYGIVCMLARSRFALDEWYALFNHSDYKERLPTGPATLPLAVTLMTLLLFGCSSNKAEALRPRAASARDALLWAYVRVIQALAEE